MPVISSISLSFAFQAAPVFALGSSHCSQMKFDFEKKKNRQNLKRKRQITNFIQKKLNAKNCMQEGEIIIPQRFKIQSNPLIVDSIKLIRQAHKKNNKFIKNCKNLRRKFTKKKRVRIIHSKNKTIRQKKIKVKSLRNQKMQIAFRKEIEEHVEGKRQMQDNFTQNITYLEQQLSMVLQRENTLKMGEYSRIKANAMLQDQLKKARGTNWSHQTALDAKKRKLEQILGELREEYKLKRDSKIEQLQNQIKVLKREHALQLKKINERVRPLVSLEQGCGKAILTEATRRKVVTYIPCGQKQLCDKCNQKIESLKKIEDAIRVHKVSLTGIDYRNSLGLRTEQIKKHESEIERLQQEKFKLKATAVTVWQRKCNVEIVDLQNEFTVQLRKAQKQEKEKKKWKQVAEELQQKLRKQIEVQQNATEKHEAMRQKYKVALDDLKKLTTLGYQLVALDNAKSREEFKHQLDNSQN